MTAIMMNPTGANAPIVLGFDARPTSRAFAEASAGVLLAAGLRVEAFADFYASCAAWRWYGASSFVVKTESFKRAGGFVSTRMPALVDEWAEGRARRQE